MADNFYRRQNDIDLSEIKTSLSNINQSLETIKETQGRHGQILFGKDEGKGGLIIDVDRLVQHKKNTEKNGFIVYSTAIGLVLKTIWDMVIRR